MNREGENWVESKGGEGGNEMRISRSLHSNKRQLFRRLDGVREHAKVRGSQFLHPYLRPARTQSEVTFLFLKSVDHFTTLFLIPYSDEYEFFFICFSFILNVQSFFVVHVHINYCLSQTAGKSLQKFCWTIPTRFVRSHNCESVRCSFFIPYFTLQSGIRRWRKGMRWGVGRRLRRQGEERRRGCLSTTQS